MNIPPPSPSSLNFVIAAPLFVSRLCFIKVPKYAFLLSLALRLFCLSFFINFLGSSMFRFILRFVFNHIVFKSEPVGKTDRLDCIKFCLFGVVVWLVFRYFYTFLSSFFCCFGARFGLSFVFWAICSDKFGCFVFDLAVLALFSILLLRTFRSFFGSHFSCSEIPNNWLSSSIVCLTSFVENLLISLQVKFVSVSVSHLEYRL